MDKIKEYLTGLKLTTALDVATGRGEFIEMIRYLAGDGIKITGVDNNDRMLKMAADNDQEVEFVKGDAYSLGFSDESFDLVCMSNSLHHFEFPEKVMSELKRILQPEGLILIQEMVSDEDQTNAQRSHIKLHHYCASIDMIKGVYHDITWEDSKLIGFIKKESCKIVMDAEYSYSMEDEFDANLLEKYLKTTDHYIDLVQENPKYESIKDRGEKLKQYLRSNGFAPAREKLYLIRK
ncbi:MAG: class I SAM-dependent methyltransferase [Candidatus Stygibacter australis]|nr:class I SAM-dependent methyltransferase [Candidatus Stygibacter australis]MDP8322367.1 class I SAM-dependent methyltransferase [Candidatus Stygibacter australis]